MFRDHLVKTRVPKNQMYGNKKLPDRKIYSDTGKAELDLKVAKKSWKKVSGETIE